MRHVWLFALNFLLPPALAASLAGAVAFAFSWFDKGHLPAISWDFRVWQGIKMWAFWAYLVGGLPSVLHAIAMAWIYQTTLPRSRRAVVAATVSGGACGVLIGLFFTISSSDGFFGEASLLGFFAVWGAVTGSLSGLFIALIFRNATKSVLTTP